MTDDIAIAQWLALGGVHLLGCSVAYVIGCARGFDHGYNERERWRARRSA